MDHQPLLSIAGSAVGSTKESGELGLKNMAESWLVLLGMRWAQLLSTMQATLCWEGRPDDLLIHWGKLLDEPEFEGPAGRYGIRPHSGGTTAMLHGHTMAKNYRMSRVEGSCVSWDGGEVQKEVEQIHGQMQGRLTPGAL
ncbi:hypothetical protein NDU88_010937 [Pleurodeles waltl]|uniref:Uncharacterized protein n=1 Tax=Pleurodeles waltl TaxID=8319 RepID=A0AAV7QZL2_PLEWA|nr:hypothetical protein NDU88_010937 [Pleurodeles waltl]